jgi:glycerate 2-kinase
MRVIIAPDSYTGTLTAQEAAQAIYQGWQKSDPDSQYWLFPISDGGPGFISAVNAATEGEIKEFEVLNLIGEEIKAPIFFKDDAAYIESALVVGPQFLKSQARTPLQYSTKGIGTLIRLAVNHGAKNIFIGVGGTASLDGGFGLLSEVFENQEIVLSALPNWLSGINLFAATDVEVPLLGPRGAVRGFGIQKGLMESEFDEAEESLAILTKKIGKRIDGKDPSLILGAGAGGGIGYALLALGAKRVSGLDLVFEIAQIDQKLSEADLLITGEGSVDWQTLSGKVIMGLAKKAQNFAVPTIALAGRVQVGKRELAAAGIVAAYGCVAENQPPPADPFAALRDLAERLGKTWRQ